MRQAIVILCFALLSAPISVDAQATPVPPAATMQHAADLFAASDWSAALAAYQDIARAYPSNALARFRVGVSLGELGGPREAESSLRQGESLGMPVAQAAYRLAQMFAE